MNLICLVVILLIKSWWNVTLRVESIVVKIIQLIRIFDDVAFFVLIFWMREIIAIVVQNIVIRRKCIFRLQIKQLQTANVIIVIIGNSRILPSILYATAAVVIVNIHSWNLILLLFLQVTYLLIQYLNLLSLLHLFDM